MADGRDTLCSTLPASGSLLRLSDEVEGSRAQVVATGSDGSSTRGMGMNRVSFEYKMISRNWFDRHHWSYQRKEIGDLSLILRTLGVPKATGKRLVNAVFVFTDQRRRDRSNYTKVIEDAMVRAGLLVDDSPEWFEWGTIEFEKGPRPMVHLEFVDVDG